MVTSLPFQTLRGRLMLLACLATLPAFFFVIYLATKDRAAALDRTEVELLYVADSASQEHANQIYGAHRLLERLASLSHGETSVDLPTLLPPILMGFPQFANLGILDLNGETIFSVVPLPRPVNMTQVPAFQEALDSNKVAIGTYLIGLIVERPILIMAKALRDSDTQPKWVLFAALELAWLDQLAKQAGLPPDSALLIVDRDGNILASSLELDLSNPVPKRLKGFKSLLQNPSTLGMCETLDNIPRLAVARPLEGVKDLWVVVGTPKSKVYAIANSVFFRDLAALTFLTMLAIICSLFATDVSVLHDIRILANTTRRFGRGELSVRAPLSRLRGEIRDLTNAFNTMAETLDLRDRQAVMSQDRLRQLSHRLQTVREEEAARIAQELHDELGQELSILRIELERLYRKVKTDACMSNMHEPLGIINELGERVDSTICSVRRISSELRPGVLDRLGLTAGLEWLLSEFERRTEIKTSLLVENPPINADSDVSIALFRITQEALTNIAKHSCASEVTTRLIRMEQGLRLNIKDNGQGFDPDKELHTPSLGLLGIRERAWRLSGSVTINSTIGLGTELEVNIPLTPNLY